MLKKLNNFINMNILKKLDNFDKEISLKIHNLELNKLLEIIVFIFARMFNPGFVICYFLLILFQTYTTENHKLFILKPLTHTLLILITSNRLKKWLARPRPLKIEKIRRISDLRQHEKNCSMPSGDSIQAANFAIILYFYYNTTIGFFLIPGVMFARIFYFCHYVFDTIVGASLGIIISSLIYYLLNF
jgi:membrane-associated phospholipid phosphatase